MDPETEEEVNSRTAPAGASELKWSYMKPQMFCATLLQTKLTMVKETSTRPSTYVLMNVCPDEIGEDSDEAYESDFEEIDY